jgi:hypothetical protein
MSTAYTIDPSAPPKHRCKCGCDECQDQCCSLECLVRPNFFCGQLLTDRDLKSLVDWVSAKSALQRFRAGWGVVCGLEATCSPKEKEQNRVYVSQGYAVDCCGRDILVCDPIWFDFTCGPSTDPCCRDKKSSNQRNQPNLQRTSSPEHRLLCIPPEELRAFDLCLQLDEQMTAGQRALVRGNCAPMDDCQYTRIKETGKLMATEVADPFTRPLQDQQSDYHKAVTELFKALRSLNKSPQSILDYIERYGGLHTFCFVEECLCREKPGSPAPIEWLDEAIFYILQDFRNHYALRVCESCKDNPCSGDGIPLSRVWLWDKITTNCRICKVVYIDSHPPYRHPFDCACPSSTPGCVDLGRYLWRNRDEVTGDLRQLGLANLNVTEIKAGSMHLLEQLVEKEIICFTDQTKPSVMYTFRDHCGIERVSGFGVS